MTQTDFDAQYDHMHAPWIKSLPYLRDKALQLGLVLKYKVKIEHYAPGVVTIGPSTKRYFNDEGEFPLALLECIVAAHTFSK